MVWPLEKIELRGDDVFIWGMSNVKYKLIERQ